MLDPLSGIPANVDVQPSARQLLGKLSPSVRALIVELLEVMERSAVVNSVPITRTELVADRDPEEVTEKIEIRQWVRLPHEMAMDHWEAVGHEIDDCVNGLPDPAADQLAEWTSFAVYPEVNDAAA